MFTRAREDAEKDLFSREWYTTGTATPPPLKSYRKKIHYQVLVPKKVTEKLQKNYRKVTKTVTNI